MAFDSLCALVLFAACMGGWVLVAAARTPSRINFRFAAMLLAPIAVARLLGLSDPQFSILAPVVALIAAPLASTLLALGLMAFLARPLPAGVSAVALALSLCAGLAAALAAAPVYAVLCQGVGILLVLAASLRGFASGARRTGLSLLAALALGCAGLCLMAGAANVSELFFAAALVSAVSQTRIQAQGQQPRLAAIG
jgi:hypothetical protein